MLGTLFSLLIAGYLLFFNHHDPAVIVNYTTLGSTLIFVGVLIWLAVPFFYSNVMGVLQRAELKATPRVTELYNKDLFLFNSQLWMIIFPLLTFVIAVDLIFFNTMSPSMLLAAWGVLLGITLDVFYHIIKKTSSYISPTLTLDHLGSAAVTSIKEEHYPELCEWIDSISEVGLQAVKNHRMSIATSSMDTLQDTLRHFLNAGKSISHHINEPTDGKKGFDTIAYVLVFTLQRLELINKKTIENKLEPVCSHAITALGKIILSCVDYDITLAQYPLHSFGKNTRLIADSGMKEVVSKAVLTLVEIAKNVVQNVDLTYLEIAPFFTGIVAQVDENIQHIFRTDKSINIKVLVQPLNDLKALFESERMSKHQDTPAILQAINAALVQYQALEEVLTGMPLTPKQGGTQANYEDDEGLSKRIVDDFEARFQDKIEKQPNRPTNLDEPV